MIAAPTASRLPINMTSEPTLMLVIELLVLRARVRLVVTPVDPAGTIGAARLRSTAVVPSPVSIFVEVDDATYTDWVSLARL